jgi:hypothetical protein
MGVVSRSPIVLALSAADRNSAERAESTSTAAEVRSRADRAVLAPPAEESSTSVC